MKSRIIDYLKKDRSFETGKNLYMEIGPSMALKTTLNRQGYSAYNHRLLLEELRKLAGISMLDFEAIISLPVESEAINQPQEEPVTDEQVKSFVTELPEEVRKVIRLRDEFPFLNKPDCPDELKILVADRITAYHQYVEAHKRLFDACTDEDIAEAASSVVENYLDNQAIWDELNHYKQNGAVLGKHPIFSKKERMDEIREMSTADLAKLKNSLMNNLARTRKKVKDEPDHKQTGERLRKIDEFQIELNEVNRLLESK